MAISLLKAEQRKSEDFLGTLTLLVNIYDDYSFTEDGLATALYVRKKSIKMGIVDIIFKGLSTYSDCDDRKLRKIDRMTSKSIVELRSLVIKLQNFVYEFNCKITNGEVYKMRQTSWKFSRITQDQHRFPCFGLLKSCFMTFFGWISSCFVVPTRLKVKPPGSNEIFAQLLAVLASYIRPSILSEYSSQKLSSISMHTSANAEIELIDEQFIRLLYKSSIGRIIRIYSANDSLLDISIHINVYNSLLSLIMALAQTPDVSFEKIDLLGALLSAEHDLKYGRVEKNMHHKCLLDLMEWLNNLYTNIEEYLSFNMYHNLKFVETIDVNNQKRGKNTSMNEDRDEKMAQLFDLVATTRDAIRTKLKSKTFEHNRIENLAKTIKTSDVNDSAASRSRLTSKNGASVSTKAKDIYCSTLKPLQFETIPFYGRTKNNVNISYHYSRSLSHKIMSSNAYRTRRIAQEIISLKSSNMLPLSFNSSVFVRASEEHMDAMKAVDLADNVSIKVLITGPSNTPYSNGCFEFDVYFPADYPNVPMLINLETTGNHLVRFNPNLYASGKVCLSILNTWYGTADEKWNPQKSSLLQVLVSIQSFIFVSEPYFNEPGYEDTRGQKQSQELSTEYNETVRVNCVQWAMIEMLNHPPKAFEDVIKHHFWLKRDEICHQIEGWIKMSSVKTRAYLQNRYELLKVSFKNMLSP